MTERARLTMIDASELREAFDLAFQSPAVLPASDQEAFLAIRVNDRPFAVRASEVSRIEPNRKIVKLPGASSTVLGVAGIQGRVTSVHSLAALLGLGANGENVWIALARSKEPFGIAFDSLQGFAKADKNDVLPLNSTIESNMPLSESLHWKGTVWPILPIPVLLAEIRSRLGLSPSEASSEQGAASHG